MLRCPQSHCGIGWDRLSRHTLPITPFLPICHDLLGRLCAAVKAWLLAGGERIDTSFSYGDQIPIGVGMKASGQPREKIFVTSKIGPFEPLGYNDTLQQFQQASHLQLEGPALPPCRVHNAQRYSAPCAPRMRPLPDSPLIACADTRATARLIFAHTSPFPFLSVSATYTHYNRATPTVKWRDAQSPLPMIPYR